MNPFSFIENHKFEYPEDMAALHSEIWQKCLTCLQGEYSEQDFNTWIRPLQARVNGGCLYLLAPNYFVIEWIKDHFLERIHQLVKEYHDGTALSVVLEIGSNPLADVAQESLVSPLTQRYVNSVGDKVSYLNYCNHLNPSFVFENFVRGKSNEFAFAAASQVAVKPGGAYNPLLIYGGVGLGKTHIMQAIGHGILKYNPQAEVLYLHSERFVAHMIKSLQNNHMEDFQSCVRSVDALLLDDVQFLAGKERSQEEFFHTFNTLIENHKQIILTCDRYPKEISGLTERLRSRFGWGLTVAVEPPELETRVAILMNKAEQARLQLSSEVAFFIARRIRSNIRELEGALKRIAANAEFTGRAITVDFVKETLKDLITLQDKLVTIENIQRTVAEYYKIKLSELLSGKRNRALARPRQMAMTLAKELTNRSFPEIGAAFGGRDHTTVIHACRTVKSLIEIQADLKEDYLNLVRILTV